MSEWHDNQKKPSSNIRQLLQGRIEKANPRRELTYQGAKRLAKLGTIADKLKRGENVQNRQLKTQDTRKELRISRSNLLHAFACYKVFSKSGFSRI